MIIRWHFALVWFFYTACFGYALSLAKEQELLGPHTWESIAVPQTFNDLGKQLSSLRSAYTQEHLKRLGSTGAPSWEDDQNYWQRLKDELLPLLSSTSKNALKDEFTPRLAHLAHEDSEHLTLPKKPEDDNATTDLKVAALNRQRILEATGLSKKSENILRLVSFLDTYNVLRGTSSMITLEDMQDPHHTLGWATALSDGFIPTLSWVDTHNTSTLTIPLLTQESLPCGPDEQESTGFVLVKLKKGVVLSREHMSESMKTMPAFVWRPTIQAWEPFTAETKVTEYHWLLLTSTAEGTHTLRVQEDKTGKHATIVFPVRFNTTTMLNFSAPLYAELKGSAVLYYNTRRLSANDLPSALQGLPNVSVRFMDSDTIEATTDERGEFLLPEVLSFEAGYPVWIETLLAADRPYRYRVLPKDMHHAILYRLSKGTVRELFLKHIQQSSGDALDNAYTLPSILLVPLDQKVIASYLMHGHLQLLPRFTLVHKPRRSGIFNDDTPLTYSDKELLHIAPTHDLQNTISGIYAVDHHNEERPHKYMLWSELTIFSTGVITVLNTGSYHPDIDAHTDYPQ